ncbi:hypothetical protein [Paenibacillus glacialis]|uniref:Uncharacterized protein n=1 Tax=Paenibacillus glacialis TaxID=494026 RepID=A0A168N320_9BACL|nr:hypothetical protein [Paenibacillus glacialis]OAB45332.1 hypothetical protein PGLA_03525 [Paenibacillus glacialis]
MTRVHQLFRLFIMIGMALVLSFSFPVSSYEERTTETSQGSITTEVHMVRPLLRQTAPIYSRLIVVAQLLPLLFMVYLLTILRLPLFVNPFKRCIPLLLRRLFLDPIKYTSTFVSRVNVPLL